MNKKIFKDDNYPIYEIVMEDDDDNTGIRLLSLVPNPAIEVQGMYFSKDTIKNYEFKADQEKMMIVGPAMIPDKKILRQGDDGEYYYAVFSKETILKMMSKFNKENNNRSINVDHTSRMVNGYIRENWIVEDPYYDKSKMYGYNLPVGTWFITCKIEDEKFWEDEVKGDGKYSFSVEGLMAQKLMSYSEYDEIIDGLSESEVYELLQSIKKKISFDFDNTLSRLDIQELAKQKVADPNNDVYIVTRRYAKTESDEVYKVADLVGIDRDNVFFTDRKFKYKTLQLLDIDEHYDDNAADIALIKTTLSGCKTILV